MKKLLALLLALVMVFSMAACSSSSDDTTAAEEEETTTTETTETEEAAEAEETEEAEEVEETAEATHYTIGIIQQLEHEALDLATRGFEDALIELLGEENVTFDFQNAQGETANCATIANSLVSEGVDLILANATSALQAAAAATSDIPILGTSVTDYATALGIDDWTGATGTNISGTSDLAPLSEQANMIAELCPVEEYPNVGILYCSAEPNSVYQSTVITGYLEEMGYTVSEYTFADSNDIASVTQNACDNSDVLFVPTDNTAAANTEAIYNVTSVAGVPVAAGESGIMSGCGIATLSISYYDIGYIAGEMAYEILVEGADITTMAVQSAPEVTKMYMADRCEELGITVGEDYTAYEG
ncbi:MAG: ABC transporter substrate-binding protein [Oscillospiraceae bacterium]|nr:ABC transporter substrate-binding protein [Oscillospiraceae bacterium]